MKSESIKGLNSEAVGWQSTGGKKKIKKKKINPEPEARSEEVRGWVLLGA